MALSCFTDAAVRCPAGERSPSVLSWELLKQRASVRRSAGFVFQYLAALGTSSKQFLLGALDLYLSALGL